jgi:hypothetical protein
MNVVLIILIDNREEDMQMVPVPSWKLLIQDQILTLYLRMHSFSFIISGKSEDNNSIYRDGTPTDDSEALTSSVPIEDEEEEGEEDEVPAIKTTLDVNIFPS